MVLARVECYNRRTAMRINRSQIWISWLCLIAFAASSSLLRGVVVCSGAEGERIEWVCDRDDSGRCLPTRDVIQTASDDGQPSQPCSDEPLDPEEAPVSGASRGSQVPAFDLSVAPPMTALLAWITTPSVRGAVLIAEGDRLPDPAVRFRCVVLIV